MTWSFAVFWLEMVGETLAGSLAKRKGHLVASWPL